MPSVLVRIKQAVLEGRYVVTKKARLEMDMDDLTELDVLESIVNARSIYKTVRSTSLYRHGREHLHIIVSQNLAGTTIYTKGKLVKEAGSETFYVLISCKRAV